MYVRWARLQLLLQVARTFVRRVCGFAHERVRVIVANQPNNQPTNQPTNQAKQLYTPVLGEKAVQACIAKAKQRFGYRHPNLVRFMGITSFIDSEHRMASVILARCVRC